MNGHRRKESSRCANTIDLALGPLHQSEHLLALVQLELSVDRLRLFYAQLALWHRFVLKQKLSTSQPVGCERFIGYSGEKLSLRLYHLRGPQARDRLPL